MNKTTARSEGSGKIPKDAIPVDGFQQVVDMLRAADPEFRESLLRRIAAQDSELARSIRSVLSR